MRIRSEKLLDMIKFDKNIVVLVRMSVAESFLEFLCDSGLSPESMEKVKKLIQPIVSNGFDGFEDLLDDIRGHYPYEYELFLSIVQEYVSLYEGNSEETGGEPTCKYVTNGPHSSFFYHDSCIINQEECYLHLVWTGTNLVTDYSSCLLNSNQITNHSAQHEKQIKLNVKALKWRVTYFVQNLVPEIVDKIKKIVDSL